MYSIFFSDEEDFADFYFGSTIRLTRDFDQANQSFLILGPFDGTSPKRVEDVPCGAFSPGEEEDLP